MSSLIERAKEKDISGVSQTTIETSETPLNYASLPDGWRLVRLRDVIREAQGGFASGERDASGVIQLRMNNVTTGGQFDWSSFIRVPASHELVQMYQLESADVLFNNTNSTELVGKSALFEGYNEPVVFSNHFTRLRTDKRLLEPRFLAAWLQHQWHRHVFAEICNRWIGQSAVQRDKLLALEIALPPLSEQKRITAILKEQMVAIEQARTAAEAQLKAAKELPAAYLREVFNSSESQQWAKKRIGDIALSVQNGIYKAAEHYGYGHPFLRMYNVKNNSWMLNLDRIALVNLEGKEEQTFALERGDLLISRVNSFELVGKCAWVSSDAEGFVFENMLIRVRLDSTVNSLFVAQQMATDGVRKQIEAVAKRAIGQASINSADLRSIEIALPPLAIQERIANELSAQVAVVEQASKAVQDQLNSINRLPNALLRQAFNGKL